MSAPLPPGAVEDARAGQLVREEPLSVAWLDDGLVTPVRAIEADLPYGVCGGVYDKALGFAPQSALFRDRRQVVGAYPERMVHRLAAAAERRPGEAVYCGIFYMHFGHFLTETLARLWWPFANRFSGTYVVQSKGAKALPRFAVDLFEVLGIADRVELLNRPTVFERIVVPEPAIRLNQWVHPAILGPFAEGARRIGAVPGEARIYLSRARMTHSRVIGEAVVEAIYRDNGFEVIHPETLTLREQIARIAGAGEIHGFIGSAFHLMLFSGGKRVVYLLRRADQLKETNFLMLDDILGNRASYLPCHAVGVAPPGRPYPRMPSLIDLSATAAHLEALGLTVDRSALPPAGELLAAFRADWAAGAAALGETVARRRLERAARE